jgi:8-oxo-dGTP pyrophosphatase MutT (NUDIX family)
MAKKDISYSIDGDWFNFRVGIFLTNHGRVLLQNTPERNFWGLPGGRVKMGESTITALHRELIEELGVDIQNIKLKHIEENHYIYMGKDVREVFFIYTAEIDDDHELAKKQDFKTLDSNSGEYNEWKDLNEVFSLDFKPKIMSFLTRDSDEITHHVCE